MSRSVVPKVRIPTVDELDTSASEPAITKKTNFTRFRQGGSSTGESSTSTDQNGSISATTSKDTISSDVPPPAKRKAEEAQPQSRPIENYFPVEPSSANVQYASGSRAGGSAIVVNSRQKGNPLLRFLRNIPYEFGQTPADYILGEACCALFLSLKFHKLHSDYVHERLKDVGHAYALQVLLVQVDIPEPEQALRELNTICFNANWTLMLAWNPEEAAELLESYKIYENKPPDFLMGRQETDPRARLVDLLTAIKSITRTDAENLIVTFGSLKNMVEATEEQLAMCPGLGLKKAKRLFHAFGATWRADSDDQKQELVSFMVNDGEGTSSAPIATESDDIEMDDLFEDS